MLETSSPNKANQSRNKYRNNHQDYSNNTTQSTASNRRLSDKHFNNLIHERGLDKQWVEANCYSATTKEVSEILHYKAKSGGIVIDTPTQVQVRPDKPWRGEKDNKAPKYRTPLKDDYDAILPTNPNDPHYWTDIEKLKQQAYNIDGVPCLTVSEGGFKAISGCSNEVPTIGLCGVEQGLTGSKHDPEGKRYLIPSLRYYAEQGFGFISAFDADCATNPNVIKAEKKLAFQLERLDVPVYSITGTWSEDEGKGMDDFIQANGIEAFREKLVQAELVRDKYKDDGGDDKQNKPPRSGDFAKELIEKYRTSWQYCEELSSWLIYEHESEGVWSLVSDSFISHAILQELKAKGLETFRTNSYMANIIGYLKDELIVEKWEEQSEKYLPFNNGVYELATGKLHNHSPGFRLTWKLPRDYNILYKEFPTISRFLNQMASNERDRKMLLYFMAAVLRGRYDLQKFLYLIGSGGTSKSTYNDLLTKLVGETNTTAQSLDELEDKHNIIDLFGKRFLALPDQTPISLRKNSNFKRLTGGDDLTGRRLYKDTTNFKFKGMTLLTSNRPFVFPASAANWLHRRMILIECNNVIPKSQRDGRLMEKMEKELPALTAYLLNIPDQELEDYIKGINEPDLTAESWEHHCQSDGLAAFVNDEVIYDSTAVTPIGSNKDRWKDDDYDPHRSALYDAYCWYCRRTGRTPKTTQTFSSDFLEVTGQLLGWQVSRDRKKYGGKQERVIKGVRLRTESDSDYPTVEEMLEGDNGDNGVTTEGDNLTNSQNDHILGISEKGDNGDNLKQTFSKTKEPTTSPTEVGGQNLKSSDQVVTPVTLEGENPTVTESKQVVTPTNQVVTPSPDFSSYPSRNSDDRRHKEKRATKCKEQMLACQTKEQIDKFKADSGFSENEYKWVWNNLLTSQEKAKISAIAKTDQLELTDIPVKPGDIITMKALISDRTYRGKVTKVEDGNKYRSIKYKEEGRENGKECVTYIGSPSLMAVADQWGNIKWQKD